MAMSVGNDSSTFSAEPNVVPMIDILLVLLIIFMITLPLNRKTLNVQIPPTDPPVQTAQANPDQIVLELTADGGFAINSQPVPKDQLSTQLHAVFDLRPAKLLFLKAAPDRTYREVIEAIDVARGSGVEIVGFTPKD
jgi:biopolymer transport protein ExbD